MLSNLSWQAILLLVVILIGHLLLADTVPFSVDEAHYALYALNLDWSYFDHPPMIGWLIAILLPLDINEFNLRVLTSILMLIINLLLYSLSQQIFDGNKVDRKNIATISLVIFNLSVVVQILGFSMVPDLPLLLFTLLLIKLLINIPEFPKLIHWVLLGILIGLLGLSKYTAIIIPFGLGIWLINKKMLLNWLYSSGFWIAIILALLIISPVFYWNYNNNWASFDYQINHITRGNWNFENFTIYLALVLLSYSPITLIWGLIGYFKTPIILNNRKYKNISSKAKSILTAFISVNLLFMIYLLGYNRFLPHWIILLFALLSPFAAEQIYQIFKSNYPKQKLVILIFGSISLLPVIFLYATLALPKQIANKHTKIIYEKIIGWDEISKTAKKIANKNNIDTIWVKNWTHASRIAWYAYPTKVKIIGDNFNQFYFWYGAVQQPLPNNNQKTLLLLPYYDEKKISPLSGVTCNIHTKRQFKIQHIEINRFSLYLCSNSNK